MAEGVDPFYEHGKQSFEIETDGILRDYNEKDIKTFVYDLFLVFNILKGIDNNYGHIETTLLERDIRKFNTLMKDWNSKYRDIILEFKTSDIECSIKIFLKDTLEGTASVIKGMNQFSDITVNADEIEAMFDMYGEQNTITLKPEKNLLRLLYNWTDILNPKSPEFRLCTYYAMKEGFDDSIDLHQYAGEFSFGTEEEEDGWHHRFPNIRFRIR